MLLCRDQNDPPKLLKGTVGLVLLALTFFFLARAELHYFVIAVFTALAAIAMLRAAGLVES